jgi:hypothetical protein
LQFFKNKLNEAEEYIIYLESTRREDGSTTDKNISIE